MGCWYYFSLSSIFLHSSVQDPNLQIPLREAEALRLLRILSVECSFAKPLTAQPHLPCPSPQRPGVLLAINCSLHFSSSTIAGGALGNVVSSISPYFQVVSLVCVPRSNSDLSSEGYHFSDARFVFLYTEGLREFISCPHQNTLRSRYSFTPI